MSNTVAVRKLSINYNYFQGPKSGQNQSMLLWGHLYSCGTPLKTVIETSMSFSIIRFISPAVVYPETIDIEVPKNENTAFVRRGLMVVAKITQNLANNMFFGKEVHMTPLNNYLWSNVSNVTRFLSELHVSYNNNYNERH